MNKKEEGLFLALKTGKKRFFGWKYNIFILVILGFQLHCASATSKCFMVSVFVCGVDKCRSDMFATVGSCLVCSSLLVGVCIWGAWSWTPRISNALPYCSWWITGGSWSRNDFPLHCLLGCVFPPDFWWLFIFLMVVNVIKNQWKRGRMTDSGTWPRVSCSSHYPSIFLHRKYLLGSQVPISSSLCFLQRVCFVYSPNSHFWQPTTLLLLQRLLRLNSEIKSKSGKPWLHWNFQDENELAKLLKKQGVAILFCEKIGSFLPSQTLDLLYKLLDVELKFRYPLRRIWLQRHLKTPRFSLVQCKL